MRWHPRPGRHATQRHLQLPQHPKVFSTVSLQHPVTDVISDLCSGPSTSHKHGATAPISPWDCYKHARHEKDKEEEDEDEEDEENNEGKEDKRTMRMRWTKRWMKTCKESQMNTPPRVSFSPLNFLYR